MIKIITDHGFTNEFILEWIESELIKNGVEVNKAILEKLWTEMEKLFYKDIQAMVIQSQIDKYEKHPDFNPAKYKRDFPFIKNFKTISTLHFDSEFNELHAAEDSIIRMFKESKAEEFLGSYAATRKELKDKENRFEISIDKKQIAEIIASHSKHEKVCSEDKLEGFIDLMEESGDVLQFLESEKLRDKIFHQPHNLINIIYVILNDNLRSMNGKFETNEAENWVKNHIRQNTTAAENINTNQLTYEVLEVMSEFRMVFRFDSMWFCPQYFQEADNKWKQLKNGFTPVYKIELRGYLHRQIVTDFFHQFGTRVKDLDPSNDIFQPLWHKDGIYLEYDIEGKKKGILVEFEIKDRTILIYVPESSSIYKSYPLAKRIKDDLLILLKGRPKELYISVDGENFIPEKRLETEMEQGNLVFKFNNGIKTIEYNMHAFKHLFTLKPDKLLHKIFISYSSKDVKSIEPLTEGLDIARTEEKIGFWIDRDIESALSWDDEIKKHLLEADFVVLILSNNALRSKYIKEVEIKQALEEDKLISVVYKPCVHELVSKISDKEFLIKNFTVYDDSPTKELENWKRICLELVKRVNK